MLRSIYLCLMFVCLLVICACKSAEVKSTNSSSAVAQADGQSQSSIQISDFAEPPVSDDRTTLKLAWQRFVADGRYRLARASDMKFTEPAKNRINESFSWWQVGVTFGNELAVLVIDSTQNSDARFGIVIFRPVEKGGTIVTYQPHWVFREKDLSNTALDRVSGYLFVHEFEGDKVYKSCEVKWSERDNRYLCRSTSG
jgi:hypothetical protein